MPDVPEQRQSIPQETGDTAESERLDLVSLAARLRDCFEEGADPGACARALLPDSLGPDLLGRWICAERFGARRDQVIVAEALRRIEPCNALEYVDVFLRECPVYAGRGMLQACLRYILRTDPWWCEKLAGSLGPWDVFTGHRSDEAVLISAELDRFLPEAGIRQWLEEGARGLHGGTKEQVARAIAAGTALQATVYDKFNFLMSVLEAPSLPADGMVGSTVGELLLMRQHWPDGDAGHVSPVVERILEDPRYARSLAAYVMARFDEEGPAGWPAQSWDWIWNRSRSLADSP